MGLFDSIATLVAQGTGERERALRNSERLGAVTAMLSSLEALASPRDTGRGQLNDWHTVRGVLSERSPFLTQVLDQLDSNRADRAFHAVRCAMGGFILLPGQSTAIRNVRTAASLGLVAAGMLSQVRSRYGSDGSDQASLQVNAATAVARLMPSARVVDATLWYIALQGVMSYAASGWVKLLGRPWRQGTALSGVMRTSTYGHDGAWRFLQKHPKFEHIATAGLLVFESAYPLVYLAGPRVGALVSLSAMSFHVLNGVVMGLGRFVWGFAAFHPAILYTTHRQSARSGGYLLPIASASLLAAVVGVIQIAALHRRRLVLDGPPFRENLETRSGNVLNYGGKLKGASVLVVMENALFATQEHYGWITSALDRADDVDFITYDRAGYGASRLNAAKNRTGQYLIDDSVEDLVSLVSTLHKPGQRLVLVGHSFGGEIIRRAARRIPSEVLVGIVLIDSTHPSQFASSALQSEGLQLIRDGQAQVGTIVNLGFGSLMERPEWVEQLPRRFRRIANNQYRDGRMWTAGRREIDAIARELDIEEPPQLEKLPHTKVSIISASRTMEDPDAGRMQVEMAEYYGAAHAHSIFKATHDSLLTDPLVAVRVAGVILDLACTTEEAK
ncbi:alpha/beta fold hydrolase [Arthrobacter flavus]|uniref:Alpha/beta fold hydrolase n=1 Tax=Arthrobacter flavus TaxID=95172 RepID=A0ABW4Q4Z3_9MICC